MRFRLFRFGNGQLPVSFAVLIAVGTLLLKLPGMLKTGTLSWIDALFTSCSAVCLNGLAVIPTAEFTPAGQFILLALIQIGCFGILSLSAIILLVAGRGLSFSNTLVMYNLNDRFSRRCTESLVRTIAGYTLISEAVGAVLMFPGFMFQGFGFWESLWYALFYSVGSFCNAGIGPLESIAAAGRYVQLVSLILIVLGGLGVYVIYDLLEGFRDPNHRMRLHSRIVLRASLILLAGGAAFLWLAGQVPGDAALGFFDALYLSAAARTAGYSTVDVGALPPACAVIVMVLMFIGGSPGSAAGGIKTSTAAVALAALITSFKGEGEVIIGRRSIAWRGVLRAFTIIVLFLLLAIFGAVMLNAFSPKLDGLQSAFEVVSALSATGLTTGRATELLTPGSRLMIAFFMFIGRVGPLSIIVFFVGREKPGHLRYPEERVIVG